MMTKHDVGVLQCGDQVIASGRQGKVASVHEPRWIDHKTKQQMHEFQGADVVFADGDIAYCHADKITRVPPIYRPPYCDLTAEDKEPKLKECPFCGDKDVTNEYDVASCPACAALGPDTDPRGHKWNSAPRRDEVAELLRLVDAVIDAPDWTRQDEIEELIKQADKLRKEWKL